MSGFWPHFVSASCGGVSCHICQDEGKKVPSSHKVGEEIPHDDPFQARHNLTAYVCCACFRKIMGKAVPCDLGEKTVPHQSGEGSPSSEIEGRKSEGGIGA